MTVVIVHDNITVNGVDCQRGDKLFGENAQAALDNPIWARSVTRAPDGVHDEPTDDEPIQVPARAAAPPVSTTAASTVAATLTDTTNKT